MSEWKTLSLRQAGVKLIDCDHRTPPAIESGYPYVALPQVKNGRIDIDAARRISPDDFAEWTRKTNPSPYDVVLSRRCNPGETAFVAPGMQFALGQNLVLLRSDGEVIFPPFLRWLVRTPEWWNQVGRFINVGAVFESLKCVDIPKFELSIPPLDEQRAIAHILGTLDDKIELNRRMNETLEAMARAIFKSWFVDFDPVHAKASGEPPESICCRLGLTPEVLALFPDSFQGSELGEIPKEWPVRSFAELCDRIAMGPFGSNIKTSNFVPHGVPVSRGGNLTKGFVDDRFVFLTEEKADQLRNSNARPGNIVITHRGTLGQVGLIPSDSRYPRYVVSQSQMVLSARPEVASGRYLYEFLRSPIGQQALLANTSQVGVPAIAQPTTSVKAIRVAAPPVTILRAYDLATKSLFDHASAVGKQSATLATIRDALLPELLTGALAPWNAKREAATV